MPDVDEDLLDGCDLDFTIDPDDELTQSLRPLFPAGQEDKHLEGEWRALFDSDIQLRSIAPLTATALGAYSGTGMDTGIADRLRAAGLNVVEVDGWKTRGSSTFHPKGSVDHHTGGSSKGNVPSLGICINGRADLSGPLCNVLIARDNTCYVIAAGRANHAGAGGWAGMSGNSYMYGVERENVGTPAEPWRADQTDVAARCHAALNSWNKSYNATTTCEHKEWAPTRKNDAHTLLGPTFRVTIQQLSNGQPPTPPTTEDDDVNYPLVYRVVDDDALAGAVFMSADAVTTQVLSYAAFVHHANQGLLATDKHAPHWFVAEYWSADPKAVKVALAHVPAEEHAWMVGQSKTQNITVAPKLPDDFALTVAKEVADHLAVVAK